MCEQCTADVAELEQLTQLAELEALVMAAEAIPGAARPMLQHEVDSKISFEDLMAAVEGAYGACETVLSDLRNTIIAVIVGAIIPVDADSTTPDRAARALAMLNANQPSEVYDAQVEAADKIEKQLDETHDKAQDHVANEVEAQGEDPEAARALMPVRAEGEFSLPSSAVAMHPWTRLTSRLQALLLDPANLGTSVISRNDLMGYIHTITLDGSTDMARQVIHSAYNTGRIGAAAALEPDDIWASELLDKATCPKCAKIDGHDYKNMAEAMVDYPNGGFKDCQGGGRCRGTLVFTYGELPAGGAPVQPGPAVDKVLPTTQPNLTRYGSYRSKIENAKSADEVRQLLAEATTDRPFQLLGGDWAGIDTDTAKEASSALLEMFDAYPSARLAGFQFAPTRSNVYAFAQSEVGHASTITMNRKYATVEGRKAFIDSLQQDARDGFHHPGMETARGVIVHEFGHVLDMANAAGHASGQDGAPAGWRTWVGQALNGGKPVADTKRTADALQPYLSKYSLTRNGTINAPEFVAEAFSDAFINGDKANVVSKAVFKGLTGLYQKPPVLAPAH